MLQAVERGDRDLRRVELERLRRHSLDHSRLEEDMQLVLLPARAPSERAPGRYTHDRSGGWRNVSRHALESQVEVLRRLHHESETVMRLDDVELISGPRAEANGLQADPPQPRARRCGPEREDLAQGGTPNGRLIALDLERIDILRCLCQRRVAAPAEI